MTIHRQINIRAKLHLSMKREYSGVLNWIDKQERNEILIKEAIGINRIIYTVKHLL